MIIENILPPASTLDLGISAVDEEDFEVSADGTVSVAVPPYSLVSQSTGTDDEITAMINAYYDGNYTLKDVQSVQAVGDIRQANDTDHAMMKIAAHTDPYCSTTSIPEQSTVKQVILDFNHDDLTTAIGSITKALITIQMYGLLGTSSTSYNPGAINPNGSNLDNQTGMPRRTQCNGNFYNAVGFKFQIKQVHKPCCSQNSSTIFYTDDYCFLPSHTEVYGYSSSYTKAAEGSIYNYFSTSANRVKKAGQEAGGVEICQQLRSPAQNRSHFFCYVYTASYASYTNAYGTQGISVCVAI